MVITDDRAVQICPQLPKGFDYNLSHDGDLVVLATLEQQDGSIGIDVMRLANPLQGDSVDELVRTISDQVR